MQGGVARVWELLSEALQYLVQSTTMFGLDEMSNKDHQKINLEFINNRMKAGLSAKLQIDLIFVGSRVHGQVCLHPCQLQLTLKKQSSCLTDSSIFHN